MTITELITRLAEIREQSGDLAIVSEWGEAGDYRSIVEATIVEVDEYGDKARTPIGAARAVELS